MPQLPAQRVAPWQIVAAAAVVALSFLPIVNWIPGGYSASWYQTVLEGWALGAVIVLGAGVVGSVLSQRWRGSFGRVQELADLAGRRPALVGCFLFAFTFVAYALLARVVFSSAPLHLDEVAQVIQARIFAEGRLTRPVDPNPEFFSGLHILDVDGKWLTQFPPGWPMHLRMALAAGGTWLAGPALGAGSVALFWGVCRRVLPTSRLALGASVLFAVSPFVMFMSASQMNHVGALFYVLLTSYALGRVDEGKKFAFLTGAALGVLGTIRPLDAAAFALPAAFLLLLRAVRHRGVAELSLAGLGIAVPLGFLLWYNARTTGSPLLFGYDKLWGASHALGFHEAPWGRVHTPTRGVELLSLYFLRLQSYLFESAIPSLVLVPCALFVRHGALVWRYWLVSGLILLLSYFAYWHDGFYLGPRFLFSLAPVLVLATVLGSVWLLSRPGVESLPRRVMNWCLFVAVLSGALGTVSRGRQYARSLVNLRQDATELARAAGVRDALILVRESWGAQLIPRMWALGVSRSATEAVYRSVDACALDAAITDLESRSERSPAAEGQLVRLVVDSAGLLPSPWSPDVSERYRNGSEYTAKCRRRVLEDRSGFALYLPVAARAWDSNIYARDLHARDSVLLKRYPNHPLFLLTASSSEPGAPLVLRPLLRDSLLREWSMP